jgi:ankyrin repeat protein
MGRPFQQNENGTSTSLPQERETGQQSDNSGNSSPSYSSDDGSFDDPPGDDGTFGLVLRAAELGDDSELRQLLPQLAVPLDTPGPDSDTALHVASLYGHLECVRLLLSAGARADVPDEDQALPLHDAAAGGFALICTELIQRAPGAVRAADADGDTPLHAAARGGHAQVVSILLQSLADPLATNLEGKTPRELAVAGSAAADLLQRAEERFADT